MDSASPTTIKRCRLRAILLTGLSFLYSCSDGDKLWEEGNYRVYKRPHSREIIMGYHFGDGGVLGLSDPTVTAAGANAWHLVYQVNSSSNFYIVREANGEGTSHGPYDDKAFADLRRQHSLPPFQWHLRK